MAESSPSSSSSKPKNLTITDSHPPHAFTLQLQPITKFRHAIASLAFDSFNPSKTGLLEVNKDGFSITVFTSSTQSDEVEPGFTEETVFGFLKLQKEFFNQFECRIPVKKMVCLDRFLIAVSFGKDQWLLNVYSVFESNEVTFEFETGDLNEIPRGRPSIIELQDVKSGYKTFPSVVYGFEAYLPSSELTPLITHVLGLPRDKQPVYVTVAVEAASVRMTVGDSTAGKRPEKEEYWLEWPFWDTLQRATQMSTECSVYMVLEPVNSLMLVFNLVDPDATMVFSQGTYFCCKHASCLAFLRSLC